MIQRYSLSWVDWELAGFPPYQWLFPPIDDVRASSSAEFPAISTRIPGSVQGALLKAGLIPDWNTGLNARQCEWIENRDWIFQTDLPELWIEPGKQVRLRCLGLDDRGLVRLNGQEVGKFENAFLPHVFDLTPYLQPGANRLQIVFQPPPRWLGQFGYTSQMTEWKPRYYYTWDWTSRLVQMGVWDEIFLEVGEGLEFETLRCSADFDPGSNSGSLNLCGRLPESAGARVELSLSGADGEIRTELVDAAAFTEGVSWQALAVKPWWPNGQGAQPLYTLTCRLLDASGVQHDEAQRRVGFKRAGWLPCEGAPVEADPWICTINGVPLFLQGFNWTPIRPNFADVSSEDYRRLLELYRDLGCNVLRVWGGAFLEKEIFYRLCDELGLLVWQEFPLSSSGVDNWPPEDAASIQALAAVAESYVARRQHHASLLCWCGGNELQGSLDGKKFGGGKPVDARHPLIRRLAQVTAREDPTRRFLPTSSSGPRFSVDLREVGRGLHWDVHGPWKMPGTLEEWRTYWEALDALFHSEVGAPGASPADVIRRYSGDLPELPANEQNPLWRRTAWWIEWDDFLREKGREPADLEEFVVWSQARQSEALAIVARTLKSRFPRCGGVIFWMGHDSFPCTANTSVIDFEGNPKPAALALRAVFRESM
jgi:beta-mannosidase